MFSSSSSYSQFEVNSSTGQDQNQIIDDPNQTQNFPCFDRNGFNELLRAIQAIPTIPTSITAQPPDHTTAGKGRKKSVRRDRHSKIVTARGPRDRRMRLSLDVAKKFFDLQDVLGFDRASKTIDWLLTKSKDAIKSLSAADFNGSKSEHKGCSSTGTGNWKIESSSTSECEVDSGNTEEAAAVERTVIQFARAAEITRAKFNKSDNSSSGKVPNSRTKRKLNSNPILVKESRTKARARARERTREKMTMKNTKHNISIPKYSAAAGINQTLTVMRSREIPTSDYNKNIDHGGEDADAEEDVISRTDPYSLYREGILEPNSINSSGTTVKVQDGHGIASSSVQFQRTWEEEFHHEVK